MASRILGPSTVGGPAGPPDRPSRRARVARACWLVAAVALTASFVPRFLGDIRPDRPRDFVQEWASARNYLEGRPVYESQEVSLKRLLGFERKPGESFLAVNAHPPTAVLLALPLARLDYRGAFLAWSLVGLGALGASLAIVARGLSIPCPAWSLVPLWALMMACNPLLNQFAEGQLGLVLLLLVVGAWAANRSGRPGLAGVCLGLATAIKLFPAFLFLPFVLGRRWRAVGAGVATVLAVTAITASVLGVAAYRDYATLVLPTVGPWRSSWNNLSLAGFWDRLLDPTPILGMMPIAPIARSPVAARLATLACDLLLVGAIARAAVRARSRDEEDDAFALSCAALPLVAPVAWVHYLTLLLLPLALLARRLPATGPRRWAFRLAVLVLWLNPNLWRKLLVLGGPERNVDRVVATPMVSVGVLSITTYALVALFLLARTKRDPGKTRTIGGIVADGAPGRPIRATVDRALSPLDRGGAGRVAGSNGGCR